MKKKIKNFEIFMHMHKIKYVPSPEIMPNPKIPHPSPGNVCLVFQGMQKGHGHYQKHVSDRGCLKMDLVEGALGALKVP